MLGVDAAAIAAAVSTLHAAVADAAVGGDIHRAGMDRSERRVKGVIHGAVVGAEVVADDHGLALDLHRLTVLGNEGDLVTAIVEGDFGDQVVFLDDAAVTGVMGDALGDLCGVQKGRYDLVGFLAARYLRGGDLTIEDVVGHAMRVLKGNMPLLAQDKRNRRVGAAGDLLPATREGSIDRKIAIRVKFHRVFPPMYSYSVLDAALNILYHILHK